MPETPLHTLLLNDLSFQVHLGCGIDERRQTQEVRVSVELRFETPPRGTHSDELAETVCYARLAESISTHCQGREFQLVERLATDLYDVARGVAGPTVRIGLSLHKVRPPVAGLLGGAVYRVADFP
jgi:dihydroneopterin aldolase